VTEPKRIRRSYKWHVEAEGYDLMLDYVFADNEAEAASKAYDKLNIPPEFPVTVQRVPDSPVIKLRLN
jgi:hypothetical protein